MVYKKTPSKIMDVINIFNKNRLTYCLFKCEHIFEGKNKNLDILFRTKDDYEKASQILEKEGFVLYLSEKVEKYKRMYIKFSTNEYTRIHLHREIAWHGLRVINKKIIFKNMLNQGKGIYLPNPADQVLIHSAHILFENWYTNKAIKERILEIISRESSWKESLRLAKINGWSKAYKKLISLIIRKKNISPLFCITTFLLQSVKTPQSWLPLAIKAKNLLLRSFSLKRKGHLISLIGANGTGKTTLVNETLKTYSPLTNSINGHKGYYFGYIPFSPWAKYLSKKNKEKNKKIFSKLSKKQTVSFKDELFLLFNYIEYLLRFFFEIYPKLRKNKVIITDRYFYDLYGQYNLAPKSKVLPILMHLFPKPDTIFVLKSPLKSLQGRGKNTSIQTSMLIKSKVRKIHDPEDLQRQQQRFNAILKRFNGISLDTSNKINQNVATIINKTWRKITCM